MKYSILLLALFCNLVVFGQDTTKVAIDLNDIGNDIVSVKVFPPAEKTSWEYVIPEIIPGTYMRVSYHKFYQKVQAFDLDGNKVKVKRSKNVFSISGKEVISHLTYTVESTLWNRRVWDNILTCGGSAYNKESALINFQVVNGYFEGYGDQVFQIEVAKPNGFYGASAIKKAYTDAERDVLIASNYSDLVDQPILYAKPDTSSFKIGDHNFMVAVYAGTGKITSEMLKPRFQTIMQEINAFSGLTTEGNYCFLMYYVDPEGGKGPFKNFGKGSALEHKNSSVYYDEDVIYDTTFSIYNWIGSHEYFHTITPLSLHSEKIHDFNFRDTDMSRHVWLYEGATDYLAMLLGGQSDSILSSTSSDMASATQFSLDRKKQSMTESGRDIISKRNVISFIRKAYDIGNYYEKGKLIAFAIDLELMERTNGERRLLDVMLEMNKDYQGSYFKDTELFSILESYTYPGFAEQFKPFIEGTELPPYETFFNKLGWTFYPKKSKLPTYGAIALARDPNSKKLYVGYDRKNELGLEVGDTLMAINDLPVEEVLETKGAFSKAVFYPEEDAQLKIQVKRDGKLVDLEGEPKMTKLKYPRMRVNPNRSEEQQAYSDMYFYRD